MPSGAMMSVNLSRADAEKYLSEHSSTKSVHIACVNSPINVTLSGLETPLDKLKSSLDADGIFAMKLRTGGISYHSPIMEKISGEYSDAMGILHPSQHGIRNIPMISSVTGKPIRRPEKICSNPNYWVENMVRPVLFSDALQNLLRGSSRNKIGEISLPIVDDLVEIGPHPALRRPVQDGMNSAGLSRNVRYTSLLSRFEPPISSLLRFSGTLFTYGYPIDFTTVNQPESSTQAIASFRVKTPPYPFDRSKKYWYESRISRDFRLRASKSSALLGYPASDWNPMEPRWRKIITADEMPWVLDHRVRFIVYRPFRVTYKVSG
jgi:acyl transferase domain-containing protein